jgi:hypothetical protein
MSVYVDNMEACFGRMIMCHMIADTTEELLDMVKKIGVNPKWIQDKGEYSEHFDISKAKRKLAVEFGAKEITMREFARMCNRRPNAPDFLKKMQDKIDNHENNNHENR